MSVVLIFVSGAMHTKKISRSLRVNGKGRTFKGARNKVKEH